MLPSPTRGAISWSEAFSIRNRLHKGKTLHVEVIDTESGVDGVSPGDELLLGEVITEHYALAKLPSNQLSERGSRSSYSDDLNDDSELTLSSDQTLNFILLPRYPLNYCFRSVQEIIEVLPAVCRLIFSLERFEIEGEVVKPRERLEIIDLIRDSGTGLKMLRVESMKTGTEFLLSEALLITFVQLPSNCYKCDSTGISATELLMNWETGQPPFTVKYCQPPPQPPQKNDAIISVKLTKLKLDKKNKHKKSALSSSTNAVMSDDKILPEDWKDKPLSFKPFQKVRVQNIMNNNLNLTLRENAMLKVRLIPDEDTPQAKQVDVFHDTDQTSDSSGRFSGPLKELPVTPTTPSPTLMIVTAGEFSTPLRRQVSVSRGHRLVVRSVQKNRKVVMTSDSQYFLVSTSYEGKFKLIGLNSHQVLHLRDIFENDPPFKVQVVAQDRNLGYDQLHKRSELTVMNFLAETTLYLEIFTADGQVSSEHPFEVSICRTDIRVRVLEPNSFRLSGSVPLIRVRSLPIVEMVTEADVQAIHNYREYDASQTYRPTRMSSGGQLSPVFLQKKRQEQIENMYSVTEKKRDESSPGHAPPRPPKSPSLLRRELANRQEASVPFPPPRPPKPGRFQGSQDQLSFNFNSNNNNNGDDLGVEKRHFPSREQLRLKTQAIRNAQRKKRSSAQELEAITKETRELVRMLSADSTENCAQTSPNNHEKASSVVGSDQSSVDTAGQKYQSITNFSTLHEHFNPENYTVDEIVSKGHAETEISAIKERVAEINVKDAAVYECAPPRKIADKGLKARFARAKGSRGLMNPIYEQSIGGIIMDPSLEKSNSEDFNIEQDPYDHASDARSALPSLTDDQSDYESLSCSQPVLSESAYVTMRPGRLLSDDYDVAIYEDLPSTSTS